MFAPEIDNYCATVLIHIGYYFGLFHVISGYFGVLSHSLDVKSNYSWADEARKKQDLSLLCWRHSTAVYGVHRVIVELAYIHVDAYKSRETAMQNRLLMAVRTVIGIVQQAIL